MSRSCGWPSAALPQIVSLLVRSISRAPAPRGACGRCLVAQIGALQVMTGLTIEYLRHSDAVRQHNPRTRIADGQRGLLTAAEFADPHGSVMQE
jgi:hypothetical protein